MPVARATAAPPSRATRPKPAAAAVRAQPARAPVAAASPAAHAHAAHPHALGASHAHCACGGTCPRCAVASHAVQSTLAEPGEALSTPVRERAERQFGADLSGVRVHTDRPAGASALALDASAFAAGQHIVFAPGKFSPGSTEGYRRLAHEIVHVLQQSSGPGRHRGEGAHEAAPAPDHANSAPTLEHEARAIGAQATREPAATFDVAPRREASGRVQRDESESPLLNRPDLLHPFTSHPDFKLKISPEMQRITLEMEFERWLAAQMAHVGPPAPTDAPEPTAAPEPSKPLVPSPAAAAAAVEGSAGAGPRLPSAATSPLPADSSADSPNVGALMAPFLARGVPLGGRDLDATMALYHRSAQWVRLLPEPPEPFRSWIPGDWRRSVAQAFTTTAIGNSALRTDYATRIEAFDRQMLNLTNDPSVVPTYINLPAIEWDFP